jgi:hypothetical protein
MLPTASLVLAEFFNEIPNYIHWAVLRGHQNLPENWDNDIDILVDKEYAGEICSILESISLKYYPEENVELNYRFNYIGIIITCADRLLKVDLLTNLTYRWYPLFDSTDSILSRRYAKSNALWIVDPRDELLIIIIKEVLSMGGLRKRYRSYIIENINLLKDIDFLTENYSGVINPEEFIFRLEEMVNSSTNMGQVEVVKSFKFINLVIWLYYKFLFKIKQN